jgi:hypothetical protein
MSPSKKTNEEKNLLERFWLPIILALVAAGGSIIAELVKNNRTDITTGSNQTVAAPQTENFSGSPAVAITPTPFSTTNSLQSLEDQFLQLLENNPSEEQILSFVESNADILNGVPQRVAGDVESTPLFRFNITQNQVPDATKFNLQADPLGQAVDVIIFIDFKSPSASLFKENSIKSDELQSAWDESLQHIKSAEENFDDFSWRALKASRIELRDTLFEFGTSLDAVIVIGRRDSLSKSEIDEIQKINGSHGPISIITYDTLLDYISKK